VPMRGTVAAASVGLSSTGELIIDSDEDQLIKLTPSGRFALLFADQDAQCVWSRWKNVPTSNAREVRLLSVRQEKWRARRLGQYGTK